MNTQAHGTESVLQVHLSYFATCRNSQWQRLKQVEKPWITQIKYNHTSKLQQNKGDN